MINSAYRELYQLQTDHSVAKPTESAIERGSADYENSNLLSLRLFYAL